MLAATSALLLLASPASGSRPPTDGERLSIAPQLGLTPECAEIVISTVDPTWAEAHSTNAAGCQMGNGYVILRLALSGWYIARQGSGDSCPMKDIHTSVSADLGLCKPISVLPYVYNFRKGVLAQKPKKLGQGAHGYYDNVRWNSWRASEAKGTAKLDYVDQYTRFRVAVKIRLYRVETCANGINLFTRRKVTALHSRDARRIRFDTKYTRYGSCKANQYTPFG